MQVSPSADAPLKHVFVNENAPLDWTCDTCGHRVKAGSRLDHQVSSVQRRPRIWRDALAALGLRELVGPKGATEALLGGAERASPPVSAGRPALTAASVASASVVLVGAVALAWVLLRPSAGGAPAAPASADPCQPPVTDVAAVTRATDPASLAGRCVRLDGVAVQSVTGDVTFWIGPSDRERAFVVLNERRQGERAVTVREGQRLRITGTIRRTPVEGTVETASDRRALADEVIYIRAERVEILSG